MLASNNVFGHGFKPLGSSWSNQQGNYQGFYLGGGLSIFDMDGDYGSKQLGALTTGFTLLAENKFNNYFVLRADITKGTLRERFSGKYAYFDHHTDMLTGELFGMFLFPSLTGCTRRVQVRPYLGIGTGVIFFETFANLYDAQGKKYHFWKDGKVKLVAENSPESEGSVPVVRDRTFETKVDSLDLCSGVAAILPAEVGIRFMVTPNLGMYISGRYTLTTSDYIDHGVAYYDTYLTDRSPWNDFPDGFYSYSVKLVYKLQFEGPRQTYSRKQRRPIQCRKF